MTHFSILYLLVTFSIGAASLILSFIIYSLTKRKLLRYYIYFYSSFTLFIFITIFESYISINNLAPGSTALFIIRQIGIFSLALIHFSAPVYVNYVIKLKMAKLFNTIFALLAAGGYIAYLIYTLGSKTLETNYYSILYLGEAIFIVILIYIIITTILNLKNINDPLVVKDLRYILILTTIFTPLIINDFLHYLPIPDGINFFPLLYCWFSILQVYYIIRNYLIRKSRNERFIEPTEIFFDKHNISKREREIFLLLIKGMTNKQIGEQLFISPFTVKTHTGKIYKKTGVNSRFELINLLTEQKKGFDH